MAGLGMKDGQVATLLMCLKDCSEVLELETVTQPCIWVPLKRVSEWVKQEKIYLSPSSCFLKIYHLNILEKCCLSVCPLSFQEPWHLTRYHFPKPVLGYFIQGSVALMKLAYSVQWKLPFLIQRNLRLFWAGCSDGSCCHMANWHLLHFWGVLKNCFVFGNM